MTFFMVPATLLITTVLAVRQMDMPLLQLILNLPFLLAGFLMKQLFFIQKGFGATYAQGIRAGICLSASKAGRAHKVPFTGRNLLHYCSLQLQLWVNLFRRV